MCRPLIKASRLRDDANPMCVHAAGREKFLEEVHKWVGTYGGKILGQLRRMGSSPDWSRLVRVSCTYSALYMSHPLLHVQKHQTCLPCRRSTHACCNPKAMAGHAVHRRAPYECISSQNGRLWGVMNCWHAPGR